MSTLQDKLYALFLLDKQVRGMRTRLDAAEHRRTALQGKLEQYNQQRHELSDQVKHAQAHASTLEHQSDDMENRITDLRDKMTKVTSNKEYSALLLEVNTLKVDKGKIEEQALELLTQVDDLKERLDAMSQQITEQQRLVNGAAGEVKQHESEVGDKLSEVTAERDEAAQQVPLDVRTAFTRLAENYEGEAMAVVIEENRRKLEYNCGGCFMSIPVERVNLLFSRPDEATICPNCGRLMYLDQELKAGLGIKS